MTPLARKIINEMTLPIKDRSFDDKANLLPRMADVHCFECTEVDAMIQSISADLHKRPQQIGPLAFLPADRTWIEIRDADAGRIGILLQSINGQDGTPHSALVDTAIWSNGDFRSIKHASLELIGALDRQSVPSLARAMPQWKGNESNPVGAELFTYWIYAALALINTPRIIGRKQHMPNRILERRLVAMRGIVGKFPLRAWTEIKLHVRAPKDASREDSQEAHYTGERALHFCRAHIRVRRGKLEIVRGHWRGDGSLGIKQSRYKVVA